MNTGRAHFFHEWAMPYGIPDVTLLDNGQEIVSLLPDSVGILD